MGFKRNLFTKHLNRFEIKLASGSINQMDLIMRYQPAIEEEDYELVKAITQTLKTKFNFATSLIDEYYERQKNGK